MEALYKNWELFRSKLQQVKPTSNGIEALCHAHDDKTASLSARLEINRGPRTASPVANCSEKPGALLHLNLPYRRKVMLNKEKRSSNSLASGKLFGNKLVHSSTSTLI